MSKKGEYFYFWERSAKYVLLLPCILVFILLTIFPITYSFILSLTDSNLANPNPPQFIGLNNYVRLLVGDPNFWFSLRVTLLFIGGVIICELLLGLGLALLLNREFVGKSLVRTIFIIPTMITPVVVGIIWRLLYNPDMGMLNYFLSLLGVSPKIWLGTSSLALISIIIADVWEWTPMVALIILSGLYALPQDPFEAAKIDGASSIQLFRYVTLPLLRPVFAVALIMRTIDAFKVFDVVYILTGGGPGLATEMLSVYGYHQGFRFFNMGYASSISFFMVFVIAIICNFYLKVIRSTEM